MESREESDGSGQISCKNFSMLHRRETKGENYTVTEEWVVNAAIPVVDGHFWYESFRAKASRTIASRCAADALKFSRLTWASFAISPVCIVM